MTYSVTQTSALAFSLAAAMSLSTLAARADSSAEPAPTPSVTAPAHPASVTAPAQPVSAPTPAPMSPAPMSTAAAPSLSEPAPTPAWAESGPQGTKAAQNSSVRHTAHRRYVERHYAYRNERRSDGGNPIGQVAMGVAGGAADLGSVAAYPFYCFPNYGSCSVRLPYRY